MECVANRGGGPTYNGSLRECRPAAEREREDIQIRHKKLNFYYFFTDTWWHITFPSSHFLFADIDVDSGHWWLKFIDVLFTSASIYIVDCPVIKYGNVIKIRVK